MANRYINWEDVVGRYSEAERFNGGSAIVNSFYVPYGETMVEGALAGYFTIPFSNNNLTIKDLAIDAVFIKMALLKAEDIQILKDSLEKRILSLRDGSMSMIAIDGTVIGQATMAINSTTKDHVPVYDVGPVEGWEVGSDQLLDIEDAKL
jgi:hypothetical protein